MAEQDEFEAEFEESPPEVEQPEVEQEEQPEGDPPEEEREWRPDFDERTQKFIDQRIVAPKVARTKEMEQQIQQYEQRLQQLESQVPKDGPPEIPELPDPWDDNHDAKMAERDAAMLARAKWDDDQKAAEERQQYESQQEEQQARAHTAKLQSDFAQRAQKAGIKNTDLAMSAGVVGNGVSAHVANYIIEHDSGPQITLYLAERADELEDLRQMSPLRAAVHIETKILPKASRKRNPPPPPAKGVRGSGPGAEDGALKGAKFG